MPDGDMRRPPLLWEQRLARRVTALGPGVNSSVASNVVEDFGATTGYDEPDDTITTLGTPSTPTVTGSLRMVVVAWDGLDTDGDAYNGANQWVDVHVGTASNFTPGTATLRGQLYEAGRLTVGDLAANTTYFARLVGKDSEGNTSAASAAGSAVTSLIINTDIGTGAIDANSVSFNARQLGGITQTVGTVQPTNAIQGDTWINTATGAYNYFNGTSWVTQSWGSASISAGAITALQLAAGAITANSAVIANGAIGSAMLGTAIITDANIASLNAGKITAGTLSGDRISGGTITGTRIVTSAGGSRIRLADNLTSPLGSSLDGIEFLESGTSRAILQADNFGFVCFADYVDFYEKAGVSNKATVAMGTCLADTVRPTDNQIVFQGYRTTTNAADIILRLSSDVTTTQPKFEVDADGDVKSRTNSYAGFSDARYKENITPARQYLDDLRQVEVVTFNWENSDQKLLGVTAQQIQPIFPNLVAEDEDGTLSVRYSVFVPMLITAVQELAQKVDDLTTRIEALEGN